MAAKFTAVVVIRSWQYFSGVGNDPKNRHFRTVSQGQNYDPEAAFIKMWLPHLNSLPVEHAHEPWLAATAVTTTTPLVPIDTQRKYEPPPPPTAATAVAAALS